MKIFISWSGEQSKQIAAAFKEWIPSVIQAARPYFSPNDIEKGSRWSNEISKELEASKLGLICLTKENLNAPWLMFEAGALSKSLEKSRVCPMLFGIEPSDLSGPLVQFQATNFSKEEVQKFINTLNQQLDANALDSKVVDSVFEKWWPDLEEKVKAALKDSPSSNDANVRSEREILEEVLALTRALTARIRSGSPERTEDIEFTSANTTQVLAMLIDYCELILKTARDPEQLTKFLQLVHPTYKLLASTLSLTQRVKLGGRLQKLLPLMEKRATELDEDIPF